MTQKERDDFVDAQITVSQISVIAAIICIILTMCGVLK